MLNSVDVHPAFTDSDILLLVFLLVHPPLIGDQPQLCGSLRSAALATAEAAYLGNNCEMRQRSGERHEQQVATSAQPPHESALILWTDGCGVVARDAKNKIFYQVACEQRHKYRSKTDRAKYAGCTCHLHFKRFIAMAKLQNI